MAKLGNSFICCLALRGAGRRLLWLIFHHKPADVTADFGGHSSTTSIPPNFFGSGGVGPGELAKWH